MTRFSPKFRTYSEWKAAHPNVNDYTKRITREHKSYPKASLSQLRGHHGKRKPLSKLKPKKERKKSPVRLVVVQGNVVNEDETETGSHVYVESYVRIADKNVDKQIQKIFKELEDEKIRIYRSDEGKDRISVNLTGERKGKDIISQKLSIKIIVDKVKSDMHPARKKKKNDHRKEGETRSGKHEQYKKEYEEE